MKATFVPSGERQGSAPLISFRILVPSRFAVQRVESRVNTMRRWGALAISEMDALVVRRRTAKRRNSAFMFRAAARANDLESAFFKALSKANFEGHVHRVESEGKASREEEKRRWHTFHGLGATPPDRLP